MFDNMPLISRIGNKKKLQKLREEWNVMNFTPRKAHLHIVRFSNFYWEQILGYILSQLSKDHHL